jgi:RNA polymerase sigma factor (sigma-70 family)
VDNIEFKVMYNAHAKGVYNFILWITRDADLSKDVLQTVFIHAWESPSFPEKSEERVRWLFTAARNACYDSFRFNTRLNRFRQQFSQDFHRHGHDPDDVHEGVFWDILSECSETERCILYLHLKAGYSYAEIARIIDLTEENIRMKVFRAMKMLREKFARRKRNGQ